MDWVLRVTIVGAALLALLIALDLTPVIVALVVLIVLVAVVAKDVVRDYIAGILIVLENHYSIGDWVRVAGEYGEVEALGLRRTQLRTEGGDLVIVPNGDIRSVTNRTRVWARVNLEVGIEDASMLDAARTAIDLAGRDLAADPAIGQAVMEPPRLMTVSDIGKDGVRLLIRGRIRAADRFTVEGEYRRLLLARLAEAGITPVTARRVSLIESDRKHGPVGEGSGGPGGRASGGERA
jgi:small conductance mechanosensitive channel